MKTLEIIREDLKKIIEPIWEHSEQMEAIANYIDQTYLHRDLVNPIIMAKAQKWDELKAEIAKFYPEDENEITGDLCDIGEICAIKFGYL